MANYLLIGTISGIFSTLSFLIIHRLLIAEIWFIFIPALILGALTGLGLTYSYQIKYGNFDSVKLFVLMIIYAFPVIILEIATIILYEKKYTFEEVMLLNPALLLKSAFLPLIPFGIVFGLLIGKFYFKGDSESFIVAILTCAVILIGIGHNVAILNIVSIPNPIEILKFKIVEYSQILVPFVVFIISMTIFDNFELVDYPLLK